KTLSLKQASLKKRSSGLINVKPAPIGFNCCETFGEITARAEDAPAAGLSVLAKQHPITTDIHHAIDQGNFRQSLGKRINILLPVLRIKSLFPRPIEDNPFITGTVRGCGQPLRKISW